MPSRTSTLPTRGLGDVVKRPRSACARARAMNRRSASPATVISGSAMALARLALHCGAGRFHFPQRVAKVGDVAERAIDGGKADVRDLVERVQLAHDHLADL